MKIFIYDFDGTITSNPMVQYNILKKCKITPQKMQKKVFKYMKDNNTNMYYGYYNIFFELLKKNNIEINIDNICYKASSIELNEGVVDYFKRYKDEKHYVVTSGFKDFIYKTEVGKYLTNVYGVQVDYENKDNHIKKIITDLDKIDAIKKIIKVNKCQEKDIIYFGDGPTDKYAFSYVHSIGGKCVLIKNKKNSKMTNNKAIDYVFEPDYSINSQIDEFVKEQINN